MMPINSFENYPMSWKPVLPKNSTLPLYKILAELLEEAVKTGSLNPGDMLPPQRELADFLDINLSTVTRAFKLCEQKGLICAKTGKGTFIAADVQVNTILLNPAASQNLIELGAAHPTYEQNKYIIEFMKTWTTAPAADHFLKYLSPFGTKAQISSATKFFNHLGVSTDDADVVLVSGGQNAIFSTLLALFNPGDRIATPSLIYPGIKHAAKSLGIQLIPIPDENLDFSTNTFRLYCQRENIKGLYLIPDYCNPTTHTLSETTRREIAAIAKKYDIIIMEDAINSLFAAKLNTPLVKLAPDQTVYIFSLSKILCAGLRIAFLAVPKRYSQAIQHSLYATNLTISPLCAEIVNQLILSPLFTKILEERRAAILQRNEIFDPLFSEFNFYGDKYCNFRWLILPAQWNGSAFETCAKNAGVQVYCAERFGVGNAEIPNAVRICTTAPKSNDELIKGLTMLKTLLQPPETLSLTTAWL